MLHDVLPIPSNGLMGKMTKGMELANNRQPHSGNHTRKSIPDHIKYAGPTKKRKCTDVFFLSLFLTLLVAMCYAATLAILNGSIYYTIYGRDSWGNVCGRKNPPIFNVPYSGLDMTEKRELFDLKWRVNMKSSVSQYEHDTISICVKFCPPGINNITELKRLAMENNLELCHYNVNTSDYTDDHIEDGLCPKLPIPKHSSFWHRCRPDGPSKTTDRNLVQELISYSIQLVPCQTLSRFDYFLYPWQKNFWEKATDDLFKSLKAQLVVVAFSIGASLSVMLLMRWMAFTFIWIIMILSGGCCLFLTAFTWWSFGLHLRQYSSIQVSNINSTGDIFEEENVTSGQICVAAFYCAFASLVSMVMIPILIALRNRHRLVSGVFQEASKALLDIPFLALIPFFTYMLYLVSWVFIIFTILYAINSGNPIVKQNGEVAFEKTWQHTAFFCLFGFGCFWFLKFVFSCHVMVISGAIFKWHFTKHKSPVSASIFKLIRYHLGTAAMGSLIMVWVNIFSFPVAIALTIVRKRSGCLSKCLSCICSCCLSCYKMYAYYLSHNALIFTAAFGDTFCRAAKELHRLLVMNVLNVGTFSSINIFLITMTKVIIAIFGMMIAILFIEGYAIDMCLDFFPITVALITSYYVSNVFLSSYMLILDTLVICYCIDSKENNGEDKPYKMSKDFMMCMLASKKSIYKQSDYKKSEKPIKHKDIESKSQKK